MMYLKAFIIGGLICLICQIILDKTTLGAPRLLVGLVVLGALVSGLGLYQPLVDFAGAGATTPLIGFGHALAKGAIKGAQEKGVLGALTGGLIGTSGGVSAAILFGYIIAVLFKPKMKM